MFNGLKCIIFNNSVHFIQVKGFRLCIMLCYIKTGEL